MATGWFQRATAAFSRPEPTPQAFDVGCDCGARLMGTRLSVPQKPACPQCGTPVFVLPASSYPVPPSVQRRWGNIEDPDPLPNTVKGGTHQRTVRETAPADTPRRGAAKERVRSSPPASKPQPPLAQRLAAVFTPLRLMSMAVVLGIVVTGLVVYSRSRHQNALVVLQGAIDRGDAALKERDYSVAAREYATAVGALDLLQRQDAPAQKIRRLHREVIVADKLLTTSLSKLLEDWLKATGPVGDLATLSGDSWLVFDAPVLVQAGADPQQQRVWQVDLPLAVGEVPVDLRVEAVSADLLKDRDASLGPQRMIFAARIHKGERPTAERKQATVTLEGSSMVLWSNADLATALQIVPTDPKSRDAFIAVLDQQRQVSEPQP